MLFAAVGAGGSVLLTTDDESHKGMGQTQDLTREIIFHSFMLSLYSFYSLNLIFYSRRFIKNRRPKPKIERCS